MTQENFGTGKLYVEKYYSANCYKCCGYNNIYDVDSYAAAETYLRNNGWKKRKDGWICPACDEEMKRNMPLKWQRVIKDARKKGYRVVEDEHDVLVSTGRLAVSVGIVLLEDGTAYRSDIPLDLTTTLRTEEQVRSILNL